MPERARRRPSVMVLVALFAGSVAVAADWSRWLGPEQTGRSPERGIFGDSIELDVTWTRPLGIAYSGIAVARGTAVTMFGDGETDWLVAMSIADGEERWRHRVGDMFPKIGGAHGGQLSMPVIDGKTVYGLSATGRLFAVKLKSGSELWSVRIDERLEARQPHFGFTTTPLVVGNTLFVQTGGPEGKSLTAFNKKNGKVKWSVGDEQVGYQSPVLATVAGDDQLVTATNTSVAGLDPADGTVLWRAEHTLTERDGWSTPIALGGDAFLLTARNESAAYRVTRGPEGFSVEQTWRNNNLKGNFAMPVAHRGHIYGFDADFLTCLDADTGERRWKARTDAAGLVLVEGHLVIFASDGHVVVAEADPAGFAEKARVKVTEEGGFTFPSFAEGAVFVRNMESIARVDVSSAER